MFKFNEELSGFFQTLFSLIISVFGEFFYSVFLIGFRGYLLTYPVIAALMPIMAEKRGAIYTTYGSRLATKLHLGEVQPSFRDPWLKTQYTLIVIAIPIFAVIEAAILSPVVLGLRSASLIVYSSTGASLLSLIFIFPATTFLAIRAFRRGWDPDNILAPIIALMGDALTLPLLLGVVIFYGRLGGSVAYPFVTILLFVFFIPILNLIFRKELVIPVNVMREVLLSAKLALIIESFTGTTMVKYTAILISYPAILGSLPVLMQASGSISNVFASKISTKLHLGLYSPTYIPSREFKNFVYKAILLYFPVYTLVAFIGSAGSFLVKASFNVASSFTIILLAGALLIPIILFLSHILSVASFKHGFDPDNITMPLLTAIMDFTSVAITTL